MKNYRSYIFWILLVVTVLLIYANIERQKPQPVIDTPNIATDYPVVDTVPFYPSGGKE